MDYLRDENRVHLIAYHLVWTPKRRKPVLTGDVATDCRALIEEKCDEMGWHILDLQIYPDHVRLTVRVWPTNSAADVVKECKAVTSHELWRKYPDLKRLPSLWTRSYFAATVGDISESMVERYIQAQKNV
jgi:putative transposase